MKIIIKQNKTYDRKNIMPMTNQDPFISYLSIFK